MDERALLSAAIGLAAILAGALAWVIKSRNGKASSMVQMLDNCKECHKALALIEQRAKEDHERIDEIRQSLAKGRAVQVRR